jgi:hypothetical protein
MVVGDVHIGDLHEGEGFILMVMYVLHTDACGMDSEASVKQVQKRRLSRPVVASTSWWDSFVYNRTSPVCVCVCVCVCVMS